MVQFRACSWEYEAGTDCGKTCGKCFPLFHTVTCPRFSKAGSKAFTISRDMPLAALPRRLGSDGAFSPRGSLPPDCSLAPRRAPRLGTPFGGLRGLCPLVPHRVRDRR